MRPNPNVSVQLYFSGSLLLLLACEPSDSHLVISVDEKKLEMLIKENDAERLRGCKEFDLNCLKAVEPSFSFNHRT